MSKPLREPTLILLCFSTEGGVWNCFVWTDILLVEQGGNCEVLPRARCHTDERSSLGHQAGKSGCMIMGAGFCIWGWNYMLGNYTVAEITACCWQKGKILLFTPFTHRTLSSRVQSLCWLWHSRAPVQINLATQAKKKAVSSCLFLLFFLIRKAMNKIKVSFPWPFLRKAARSISWEWESCRTIFCGRFSPA